VLFNALGRNTTSALIYKPCTEWVVSGIALVMQVVYNYTITLFSKCPFQGWKRTFSDILRGIQGGTGIFLKKNCHLFGDSFDDRNLKKKV
jgi:hypothetical protein